MRRAALLLTVLASSTTLLAAQSSGSEGFSQLARIDGKGKVTTIVVVPQGAPACPVQMHAAQGSGHGLVAVRNGQPAAGPVQHIHLVLAQGQASRVVSATVTAFGLSGKSRSVQTIDIRGPRPDHEQTLAVQFAQGEPGTVAADLALPGFTAVLTIRLDEVTYSDGTSWKLMDTEACRVAPDPLMLVSAR